MKKRLLLALGLSIIFGFVSVTDSFAMPSNYDNCISTSGRGEMESIRWACNGYFNISSAKNWCSMWLGPSDNSFVKELPKVVWKNLTDSERTNYKGFRLYGMCVNGTSKTGMIAMTDSSLPETVGKGDNSSVKNGGVADGPTYIGERALSSADYKFLWSYWYNAQSGTYVSQNTGYDRPEWTSGGIGGYEFGFNLEAFMNIADERTTDDPNVTEYSKTVRLYRCSDPTGAWSKVCSSEVINISIKIEKDTPDMGRCGDWTPASYLSSNEWKGETSVTTKVRNHAIEHWNYDHISGYDWGWYDEVYAKPTDKIEWIHCYYPGVQTTADTQVVYNGGWRAISSFGTWNNFSSVTTDFGRTVSSGGLSGDKGDVSVRSVRDWYEAVDSGFVGKSISELIKTGIPTFVDIQNGGGSYSRRDETRASSAKVLVPYNFSNTITLGEIGGPVFAGGKVTINNPTVTVGKRKNDLVKAEYATNVKDAKVRLIAYVSNTNSGGSLVYGNSSSDLCGAFSHLINSCNEIAKRDNLNLNSSVNLGGSTEKINMAGGMYNVYDTKAGNYFCVRAAIYPYTSGANSNMSPSGDGQWYISEPKCAIVAKNPTFQVLGGSLYSSGSIETSENTKTNLAGVEGYGYVAQGGKAVTYGSWVEQSITAKGAVKGLSSGAATGKNSDSSGSGDPSGNSFCNSRTPLSFANYDLGNNLMCPTTMAAGNIGDGLTSPSDREDLKEYWDMGATAKSGTLFSLSDATYKTTATGKQIKYLGLNKSFTLGSVTAKQKITETTIVRSSGNITVFGNFVDDNKNLTGASEIKKLIIIAGNDIIIGCSVNRVDALLIAGGEINTCNSTGGINSEDRSKQLTINGATISDRLKLNRTYGAATGTNSGVPAEIINYDASVLIWGNYMSTGNANNLVVTSQRELPPRY
ncbi:MAG: hypothetical protein Q4A79_00555 [Candidatus Saccharibacteria bacterium]|nr:hypothetical protein [Candidatus Saccharibacteria bacterium]